MPRRARPLPAVCALSSPRRLPLSAQASWPSSYAISYSGAAIPAVIAGQLARTLSLFEIALGYGALAAIACLITLIRAENPIGRIGSQELPDAQSRAA